MRSVAIGFLATAITMLGSRPSGANEDSPTLNLQQLLAIASARAPAVVAAQAQAGLAQADVVRAQVLFPENPELSFAAGGRTAMGETGLEFELGIRQQVEIAGEPGLRIDAARDQQRLRKNAVNEVRWHTLIEVRRLFANILLTREHLVQAERFVAFAESMRDIAVRQVEAGESSPLVSLVANAELAQAREAVIVARRSAALSRTQLAAVIGWQETALPRIKGTLPKVNPAPSIEHLIGLMMDHHPSLHTRELAVIASRSRLALERRQAWPKPTLGVTYAREAALELGNEANVWLFSLDLPIPMWRTNQEGRTRAEATVVAANGQREATVSRLRGELLQATASLNAAVDRVALYETGIVPQLAENLTLLRRMYELGEVDIHQVSQTRERLLDATSRYVDARQKYYEAATTLQGLVGTEIWPEVTP